MKVQLEHLLFIIRIYSKLNNNEGIHTSTTLTAVSFSDALVELVPKLTNATFVVAKRIKRLINVHQDTESTYVCWLLFSLLMYKYFWLIKTQYKIIKLITKKDIRDFLGGIIKQNNKIVFSNGGLNGLFEEGLSDGVLGSVG